MLKPSDQVDNKSSQGTAKNLIAFTASALLSGCVTVSHQPTRDYSPVYVDESPRVIIIPRPRTPEYPQIIEKKFSHRGQYGDNICTYVYNTRETVRSLCEPKLDRIVSERKISVPRNTRHDYRKHEHDRTGKTYAPRTEHGGYKTLRCVTEVSFDQRTGKPHPPHERCHGS